MEKDEVKKKIRKLIRNSISFAAPIIYRPRIVQGFRWIKNCFVTCAYEGRFNKVGKNCYFGKDFILHDEDCITIGDNFRAGDHLTLEAWKEYDGVKYSPNITIGDNVVFTDFVQISCVDEIIIGNDVLLGHAVYISDNFHGKADGDNLNIPPVKRELYSKGPVKIGNNVWIGRHVSIMPGVTIGDNSIIGANSVVTKDIAENSVAAGCPAKIIKEML